MAESGPSSAVEPDASALRAIVDLDALALARHQRDGAMGADDGTPAGRRLPP